MPFFGSLPPHLTYQDSHDCTCYFYSFGTRNGCSIFFATGKLFAIRLAIICMRTNRPLFAATSGAVLKIHDLEQGLRDYASRASVSRLQYITTAQTLQLLLGCPSAEYKISLTADLHVEFITSGNKAELGRFSQLYKKR